MRVAMISPMISALAEPFPGGTEVLIAELTAGLSARGHTVTLFAPEGSTVPAAELITLGVRAGSLRWPGPPESFDGATMRALLAAEQAVFHQIFSYLRSQRGRFDLVHNHSFSGFPLLLADTIGIPFLTTLHVPPILVEQVAALRVLAQNDTPATLVAVSHALAGEFQEVTRVTRVIHNGVAVPELDVAERTEDLLFIGRMAPEKGADLAIAVARAAGRRLRLIGRIEDQVFYQRHIAPAVDGEQVVYLGHLPQREAWNAMARAAALLFTPRWAEACSLAVLEGMALGTPAIAFALGGLVEQIVDGQTGFLLPAGDLDAAAAAVGRLPEVSAASCRAHIRQYFSQSAMVGAYEAFYREQLDHLQRVE